MDIPALDFHEITPVAPAGLGGLIRDHFSNGRMYATLGAHGGLLGVGYWGKQHLGASHFFRGDAETAWTKLFRVRVRIHEKCYYPTMTETRLYPFGCVSSCTVEGVKLFYEMLLLPDALVQRIRIAENPAGLSVQFEVVHQESCTAVQNEKRSWGELAFQPFENALVVSCRDESKMFLGARDGGLGQRDVSRELLDAPDITTWIGIGGDFPLSIRRGYRRRSKYYISSAPVRSGEVASFVVFSPEQSLLNTRLQQLAKSVHAESDELLANYESRLHDAPRIDVGDSVLNSAFGQYPAVISSMELADRPGAVRATVAGYFVWGWDGMTPIVPWALANDAASAAAVLRFFHETIDPEYGLPHQFTTSFALRLIQPFASQCQYIASLYHYVATTGDLDLVKEVWPTCLFILDGCRRNEVGNTGLCSGNSFWPDEPKAMEENGCDISALNNSFLYQGLRCMEFLARALDDSDLADECRQWAFRLRSSFVRYLYDAEQGFFITSCCSKTFTPRKHYACQVIFWITPFARELVSHAPERIADFMEIHLRSDKCLLSLPQWDTAWMADGNQIGASFPAADYFYLNIHKVMGDHRGLQAWLGDVQWFWLRHTAPEAFTPEAENEGDLGPDNPGCKQLQAVTCWYAGLYMGLAGMDLDHDGLTLTPWGHVPVRIRGLRLREISLDLSISGTGSYLGSLSVNGERQLGGSHKLSWDALKGPKVRIDLVRSEVRPSHPVILRADGLNVQVIETEVGALSLRASGSISGEIVIMADASAMFRVNDQVIKPEYRAATGTFTVAVQPDQRLEIKVSTNSSMRLSG